MIPEWGRSPGEGNSYPLQYSGLESSMDCRKELDMTERLNGEGNGIPLQYFCLENPMDGGAWWATVHGVARIGYD